MSEPGKALSPNWIWLALLAVPLLLFAGDIKGRKTPAPPPAGGKAAPAVAAANDGLRREVDRLRRRLCAAEGRITDLQENLRKQREQLETFSQWSLKELLALRAKAPQKVAASSSSISSYGQAHGVTGRTGGAKSTTSLGSLLAAASTLPASSAAARAVLQDEIRKVIREDKMAKLNSYVRWQTNTWSAQLLKKLELAPIQEEQVRPVVEAYIKKATLQLSNVKTGVIPAKQFWSESHALAESTRSELQPMLSTEQYQRLRQSALFRVGGPWAHKRAGTARNSKTGGK